MFTIEKTDLHPALGATVAEVVEYLKHYDREHTDARGSFLYELTGFDEPEELITCNPYAIKFLEQHPEFIRPSALHRNDSEEALRLRKLLGVPDYEQHLGYVKTKNLDTYLQDACANCINFRTLSSNPHAFPFLRKHLDKVNWASLSLNPEALDLLEYYQDNNISFLYLSCNTNPRAMAILRNNMDQISWEYLSENPCDAAIDLLEENPDCIWYEGLAKNTNPRAIDLLMSKGLDNVNWWVLSSNPCRKAVQLLVDRPEKIVWQSLCLDAKTPQQFELIRNNPDKIVWSMLCLNDNEGVLPLLIEHQDKIEWWYSLSNQAVFETLTAYDYAGIRGARRTLHEEYHAWAGHPIRLQTKWKDWGLLDEDAMEEEN